MCGRYNLITDATALLNFFEIQHSEMALDALQPRYNIAPSQQLPVVRRQNNRRELVLMRWGLVPSWSKQEKTRYSMINARAEWLASKPAYRSAFRSRRCLVPASGFYEWQTTSLGKQPWLIHPRGSALCAFAGLWEHWEGGGEVIESFTIIVTEANILVQPIHDRMPVILAPAEYSLWLDPANTHLADLPAMLDPYPSELLECYPVSRRVNSPKYDDEGCIRPRD